MNHIHWPDGYLPGFSDNFASNEVIATDLSVADVWPLLNTATKWPTYYDNSADVTFHNDDGPELFTGQRFSFKTFGFQVEAEVTEHVAPSDGQPARVAWHGWAGDDAETRMDVHHAWLLEDLDGGRVRILTQKTQNGKPAKDLAETHPNPMINGHQDWLDGLIKAARERGAG